MEKSKKGIESPMVIPDDSLALNLISGNCHFSKLWCGRNTFLNSLPHCCVLVQWLRSLFRVITSFVYKLGTELKVSSPKVSDLWQISTSVNLGFNHSTCMHGSYSFYSISIAMCLVWNLCTYVIKCHFVTRRKNISLKSIRVYLLTVCKINIICLKINHSETRPLL